MAPFRASALPGAIDAPVSSVMLVRATMLPAKRASSSTVAELPICQKTLQAVPPWMTVTVLSRDVQRAPDLEDSRRRLGSPFASSVRFPTPSAAEEAKQYTPGRSVRPARQIGPVSTFRGRARPAREVAVQGRQVRLRPHRDCVASQVRHALGLPGRHSGDAGAGGEAQVPEDGRPGAAVRHGRRREDGETACSQKNRKIPGREPLGVRMAA